LKRVRRIRKESKERPSSKGTPRRREKNMFAGMTGTDERRVQALMETRGYHEVGRREDRDFLELLVKPAKREETILIRCVSGMVGVESLRKTLHAMNTNGVSKAMIIACHGSRITYPAKAFGRQNSIELIPEDFPPFNIFKHKLVPLHEILTEKEKKEMLREYHIEIHHLPRIVASDPAVIAIGGEPGDVIRITRDSPTAGKHIYHRLVVDKTGEPPAEAASAGIPIEYEDEG